LRTGEGGLANKGVVGLTIFAKMRASWLTVRFLATFGAVGAAQYVAPPQQG